MLRCLKEYTVINKQIKDHTSWVETGQTDRDAAQMGLSLDSQRYENESRIHAVNTDVTDEPKNIRFVAFMTFDCAICVLLLHSLPFGLLL